MSHQNNGILLQNDSNTAGMRVADQPLAVTKRTQRQKSSVEDKVSRLEKYEELDKNHPLNRPFTGSSSFRGPVFSRRFTNLICVLIFLIANAAFLFYGIIVWRDGASGRLTKGMDFRAEICGLDKLKSKKFLYYASPAIDLNVKFCVDSCPSTSGQKICLYDVDPKELTTFCYTQSATTAVGLFCLPNEPINRKIVDNDLSSIPNLIKRIAGDIGTAMDIIAAGLIVAFIMAAIFLRLMFNPQKIKYVIWISIWATVVALILLAGFFYKEYLDTIKNRCIQGIDKRDCGGYRATIFKVASFVCLGIDLLYFLLVMKIFNRINLGVGVLQAAARCSTVFSQIKFLPFALTFAIIFVAAFFLVGTVLGFSVGEIKVIEAKNIDGGYVKTIEYSDIMRYLVAFNFFMLQWWFNVVLLVGDTILSYALSIWYFEKRRETLILPTYQVVTNVLKYHLGTVIMIGIYKIIFRPFRLIMSIITLVMKKPKQHLNIVRFMQACCLCCIHVHERILRYQTKHCVVQTAMWSESYRVASKRAWFLLFRNSSRFRNLDSLTTFILFLTKIVCALVGSLFVYSYIILVPKSPIQNNTSEIETPLAPTILVFYFGFFFSSIFQSAFDIATKTLLQCYLMDEEMFVGEQRFASKDILSFIDYHRIDDGNHAKFGKLQQYVKGMKGTLDANVPLIKEEDPDEEENRKLEKKIQKGSEESDEEEEEEQPQQEKPKAKEVGSDDDESEGESDSDESEEEDDQPALFKGGVFGQVSQPNHQTFAVEFGKQNTVRSLQASTVHVAATPSKNMSQFGKTAFSIEKVDESRDSGYGNKSRESPFLASKKGFGPDISHSDDGDTQLMKHKSDVKDKSSVLFGEWNDLNNELDGKKLKDNASWKPLENSVLSSGSAHSMQSKRPLMRRQERPESGQSGMGESRMNIGDASMISQKIEKSNVNNNNTMRSDKHNLFNKSKLVNASTMRLEYDDDEEDTSKYRL